MRLAVFLLSGAVACFCQTGAQNPPPQASQPSAVDSADRQFATAAARANLAEVALGKLALEKSQNADVKKFAQRMVDEHGQAEQDLQGVASKNNLTLPQDANAMQKAEQKRMEKLTGAAFDRAYMQMMVKDHTKDVAEFRKEANSTAANSDLRDYAKRTYPVLDDHLTNAKAVHDALSSKASGNKPAGKAGRKSSGASPSPSSTLLLS